jgi:putative zincin peptidase
MKPTQSLPTNFKLLYSFSLKNDIRAAILLQIVGIFLLVLFGLGFTRIALWMRPDFTPFFALADWKDNAYYFASAVVLMIVVVLIHEFIHGVFFWLFTGDQPKFGIGPGYAYASAPKWYIPRGRYVVIGLSPLVLISLIGIVLIALVNDIALIPILFSMTINAAGAAGDMWMIYRILREPREILVNDMGDGFSVYKAE